MEIFAKGPFICLTDSEYASGEKSFFMQIGRSAVTSSQSNHKTNLLNQFQVIGDKEVNKKQGKFSKIGSLKCINLYSKKNENILKKKNFALLFKDKKTTLQI